MTLAELTAEQLKRKHRQTRYLSVRCMVQRACGALTAEVLHRYNQAEFMVCRSRVCDALCSGSAMRTGVVHGVTALVTIGRTPFHE